MRILTATSAMTALLMHLKSVAPDAYKVAIMATFAMGAILLFTGVQAFQQSLELYQLILSSYCNTSGSAAPKFMPTHCLPCYQMLIGGLLMACTFYARNPNKKLAKLRLQ